MQKIFDIPQALTQAHPNVNSLFMIHLIYPDTLHAMMQKNEAIIIDVREAEEFNETKIEGAILMPLGTVTLQKLEEVSKNGKKVVIQCRSGIRSMKACNFLLEQEKDLELYHLEGGILAWNEFKQFVK